MAGTNKGKRGKNLLALILCIPLAFIVYFAISFSSETISRGNIGLVTVEAPGCEPKEYKSREEIDFLVSLLQNSKQISTAIRDVSNETPVYIIYDRGDKTLQYKFYPTLNLSGCLMSGPDGKLSLLDSKDAGKFLLHDEFAYLYSSYGLPELNIVSGDTKTPVAPVDYDWQYKKSGDVYYDYTLKEKSDGTDVYSISSELKKDLVFSTEPDELTDVSYSVKGGAPLQITGISSLDFSADTRIIVSFTAKWNGINTPNCRGTAKYYFEILYDMPAEIKIEGNEFLQGSYIKVIASHLNENETVTVNIDTANANLHKFDLTFSMSGEDTGIALIPLPISASCGDYTFKFTPNSIAEASTVTVKERNGEWQPIVISTEDYNAHLSPDKIESFNEAIQKAAAERPVENYFEFDSGLHSPVGNKDILFKFGDTVNLGNAEIAGDAGNKTVTEIVYSLSENTSVRSAQAGKVVFADTLDTTGNTVIIYHGYGIYSYYFHLNEMSVSQGTTVTDGEIIGVAGQTGFTGGKTVLGYGLSIYGEFIDPLYDPLSVIK